MYMYNTSPPERSRPPTDQEQNAPSETEDLLVLEKLGEPSLHELKENRLMKSKLSNIDQQLLELHAPRIVFNEIYTYEPGA